MAAKMQIEISFKKEAPGDLEEIETVIQKKLKVKIKKVKAKAKNVIFFIMAKNADDVDNDAVIAALKKTSQKKEFKGVNVAS